MVGQGEVKTLIFFEAAAPHLCYRAGFFYCGFYLNELFVRLLQREDPRERLFVLYGSTLSQLSQGETVEPVLRRFEIELLDQLGYGLVLDRNGADGSPLHPDQRYHYELDRGRCPAVGLTPWESVEQP